MPRNKHKQIAEVDGFANVFSIFEKEDRGWPVPEKDHQLKGKWHSEYFEKHEENGDLGEIVLEIGCGHGDYTINLAQKFPQKNFIGLDVKGNRLWNGAKKASELELKNVAFVRDAADHLEKYFHAGEVSEIWVTFPDPHPKPCRSQKRLISHRYLEIYQKILKENGVVHFKTDNPELFEFGVESVEEFLKNKKSEKTKSSEDFLFLRDIHNPKVHDQKWIETENLKIFTFYERKFMAQNIPINYLRVKI